MDPVLPRFVPATAVDIPRLCDMAARIWRTCYPEIISSEQIEYMLAWMYAPEVILSELNQGVRWEMIECEEKPVGFISYAEEPNARRLRLNKLYVLPECQGGGLGQLALGHVRETARRLGCQFVELRVNQRNTRAIRSYKRFGFRVARTALSDIGCGFVMDDFVMTLEV